jgi:hypothetical protein
MFDFNTDDDDMITGMATALITASTRAEGDSPLDVLLRQAKARREFINAGPYNAAGRKAREAVAEAHEYAEHRFPASLGLLLNEEDWTGYPPTWHPYSRFTARPACAVAFLGDGAWLRYESWIVLPTFATATRLTLLHPCPCGRGYSEQDVTDEDELLSAIEDLAAPTDGSECNGYLCAPVPCGSGEDRPYFLEICGEMPGIVTGPTEPRV